MRPQAALDHATATGHAVAPREARDEGRSRQMAAVIWDHPAPVELDIRSWKCRTCYGAPGTEASAQGRYFAPAPEDVQRSHPGTLCYFGGKHGGTTYFTSRWLAHYLTVLYECMNFRAARRRMVDVLLATAVPGSDAEYRIMNLLEALPTSLQLRGIACQAFSALVKRRVHEQQQHLFAYSGQGIRLDGHFKAAKIVLKWRSETRRWERGKYTCLLGFCGSDGALLQPAVPARGEAWADIEAALRPLLRSIIAGRLAAGYPWKNPSPSSCPPTSSGGTD